MEISLEELGIISAITVTILSPIYYQLYIIGHKLDKVNELSNRALTIVELCPHCPNRGGSDDN